MADERDFELLDDYITNRLDDAERRAFEQKLQADPDLQQEYSLQSRLIKGIKDARVAELKAMLNQVPIPAADPGNAVSTKIVLGTVVTLIIAAATFWYISRDDIKANDNASPARQETANEQVAPVVPDSSAEPEQQKAAPEKQNVIEQDKNQTSAGTEHSRPSLAKRPDPVPAPGEKKSASNDGVMVIETEGDNAQYNFHYQLRNGKLHLFGPFEGADYEVVELTSEKNQAAFLYYKEQFYKLEDADSAIHALSPVTDRSLIEKLKESRNSGK